MKIIDFKTVSPLFEMERDGIKSFTERLIDLQDNRFKSIIYGSFQVSKEWGIRITNPATGENFTRQFDGWERLWVLGHKTDWMAIFLGKLVTGDKQDNAEQE